MLITFYTPGGDVAIDTETVSDEQLEQLGIARGDLPDPPIDLPDLVDNIKAIEKRLEKLEKA